MEICQDTKNPRLIVGMGMVTGEEVEPIWVELGHGGAISRDANPGHRHELLDSLCGDWNYKKMVSMGKHHRVVCTLRSDDCVAARSLLKRAKDVRLNLSRTADDITQLSKRIDKIDPGRIKRWVRDYRDPWIDDRGNAGAESKSRYRGQRANRACTWRGWARTMLAQC